MARQSKMDILRVHGPSQTPPERRTDCGMRIIRASKSEGEILRLFMPPQGRYYRRQKRQAMFIAAEAAANAVLAHRPKVVLPPFVNPVEVNQILNTEYPELFMMKPGGSYIFSGMQSELFFEYNYDAAQTEALRGQIDATVSGIVRGARRESDDPAEQLRFVYEWFCMNLVYHTVEPHHFEDYTPVGVFVRRKAVCAGFARAYQMICKRLGIDSAYICGGLDKEQKVTHAWNMVWVDGDIYHVDVTTGVCMFEKLQRVAYPDFMLTARDMLRIRYIEAPYPRRDNPAGTYAARGGLRFDDMKGAMAAADRFARSGRAAVSMLAGDGYDTVDAAVKDLLAALNARHVVAEVNMYGDGSIIVSRPRDEGEKTIKVVRMTVI